MEPTTDITNKFSVFATTPCRGLISVAGLKLAPRFAKLAIALQEDEANLIWTPVTAMPPSPTAAAQRLTEPDRTSPAAKIPGRLVSSGPGWRLFSFQAGAFATVDPVLMNPLSSRSISSGSHSVHGLAPIMEKIAGVRTTRRSPVFV